MATARRRPGLILLPAAVLVVLAGMWGGLVRLGYNLPAATTTPSDHGFLMAIGFIGTLIAVERAVALSRAWAWAAPVATAVGAFLLLSSLPQEVGRAFLLAGGVVLTAVYARLDRIQRSAHNTLMGLAAVGWVVGAALWLADRPVTHLIPWLAAFLVITITAERLELSRLIGATRTSRRLLIAAIGVFIAGAILSVWQQDAGLRVAGAAIAGLALWLVSFDLARRTIKQKGVTRFMAAGLLIGYGWLAAGGGLWLGGGYQPYTAMYDAQVHAVFLGFVMSMIFAHAPVIAPSVLRRPMPYSPAFYGPLVLLHVSLLLRIVFGDAFGFVQAWRIGGILNEIAILGFVVITATTIIRSRKQVPPRPREAPPATLETNPRQTRTRAPIAVGGGLSAILIAVAVIVANTGGGTTYTAAQQSQSLTPLTDGVAEVTMQNMRYHPSTITVAPGTDLTIRITNKDGMEHDLKLADGAMTPMVAPGKSASLHVGKVTSDINGWCTVPGHRQAGMTMKIVVATSHHSGMAMPDPNAGVNPDDAKSTNLAGDPPSGWQAPPAALAAAPATTVHNVTWHAKDVKMTVAPGVTQTMWTFNGTVPGPTLRGHVGDRFNVTLVNDTDMPHSLDFHAESGPPSKVMADVAPGESITYSFVATHAGAWLYHCGTMPMLLHLGNGMYGALIIDPPNLAPAQEFVLVGSELFFGPQGESGDYAKMIADKPDAVVFNGYPFAYQHAPIPVKTGELTRIWVIDAGPSRSLSFHIVGSPFTTVFLDGGYLVRPDDASRGAGQTLPVTPGDGGFVETTFTQAGDYPFLTHTMSDAVLGAEGIFRASD